MLIERDMRELAENKEYIKVFNYFNDEYTKVLRDFLIRNEVEVKDDDVLINYIVKTRTFMPQYRSYTFEITNALYNEDLPEPLKYDMLMSSYPKILKAFGDTKID